jgi:lysophospholipase L1-like esterase
MVKKIIVFLLFTSLGLLLFNSSVLAQSNVTWSIGMGNVSNLLYAGAANMVFVGDSITVMTSTPRIEYGVVQEWQPLNWAGIIQPAISGVSDQGGAVYNEPTSSANYTIMQPGQIYSDGTSGYNLQGARYYNFTADLGTGGTMMRILINTVSFANQSWFNNTAFRSRFFWASSAANNMSVDVRIGKEQLDGNVVSGSSIYSTNQTPMGIYWNDQNISPSNGALYIGNYLQSTAQNENNTIWKPLAANIRRIDINNTGLLFGQIGSGGFTTRSHARGGEVLNISSYPINTNTSYRDDALQQWISGNNLNIFIIWLGQNSAYDEWDGSSIRNYTSNVVSIVDRYTTVWYQAKANSTEMTNFTKPYFILLSTYDTSSSNSRFTLMSAALRNITLTQSRYPNIGANASVAFLDLEQKVYDLNGSYTLWQGSYLSDGVHPSSSGARAFSKYIWEEVMHATSSKSGTLGTLTFTSQSWLIHNATIATDVGLFNNTDMYPQQINFSTMNSALIYNTNGSVYCSNTPSCTGNGSYSLANFSITYALNNFNASEFVTRNSTPIWYSLSNSSTKKIASNLTQTINATIVFNVTSCGSIARINENSSQQNYVVSYTSSSWSCADTRTLVLSSAPLEGSSGGNDNTFLFVLQDGSSIGTSGSSGSGSSGQGAIYSNLTVKIKTNYSRGIIVGEGLSINVSVTNVSGSIVPVDSVVVKFTDSNTIGGSLQKNSNGIYEGIFFPTTDKSSEIIHFVVSALKNRMQISETYETMVSMERFEPVQTVQVSETSIAKKIAAVFKKANVTTAGLSVTIAIAVGCGIVFVIQKLMIK